MADIKFECPECAQRIAVDETAAGLQIDCPTCRSALVIPPEVGAPAQVLVRRKLASRGPLLESAFAGAEPLSQSLAASQAEVAYLEETAQRIRAETHRARVELELIRQEQKALCRAVADEKERLKTLTPQQVHEPAVPCSGGCGEAGSGEPPGPLSLAQKMSALERERDQVREQLHEVRMLLQRAAEWKIHANEALTACSQLQGQLDAVTAERDALRAQLAGARADLDAAQLTAAESPPRRVAATTPFSSAL